MSITTELKQLRQQVEKLQIEVNGRQSISSRIVWDPQNESSVNQETSRRQEEFNGLIIHLTPETSRKCATKSMSRIEFEALKAQIRGELDQSDS